jgi:nitrous oxidase accessory protein NosD
MLAIVYIVLVGLIRTVSAGHGASTIYVKKGDSIQAAINSANSGDRIVVESGTYAEQLTISKDGIALIGQNAILKAPPSPTTNTCSGLAGPDFQGKDTQAGICVEGSDVELADFDHEHRKFSSVGHRVKGVSITGFSVRGFLGLNIAIVGAQDALVTHNTLTDGGYYGLLTVGSINSRIEGNSVVSSPPTPENTFLRFIGICMDDEGPVTARHNVISGYNIALCLQTDGADIYDNHVSSCCVGGFVDPGKSGIKIRDNEISDANPACKDDNSGSFGVWGIVISGAVDTFVNGNKISGMTDSGRQDRIASGVAVVDDIGTGSVASGNRVVQNQLWNNDVDILVDTKGKGNVVKHNQCKVSIPPNLCYRK